MRHKSRNALCLVAALIGGYDAPLADQRASGNDAPITADQVFERMLQRQRERQAREPWNPRGGASNPYELLEVKVEDWYATEEGRFAHSIKIPNPVPEDSGYRPGMTQREYFEHLCKNEAGEFIFETVDNVEGIFQLRPRKIYSRAEKQHLYAIEDPYGYWDGEAEDVGFTFVGPDLYDYFEIPAAGRARYGIEMRPFRDNSMFGDPPPGAVIARHYDYQPRVSRTTMKIQYSVAAKSRYGFTWRGVKRPHDRELGIAGGEQIVLDLKTNEVLGVRRGYVVWNGGWTARMCPRYGYGGGQDKTTFFTAWFVAKVARPSGWRTFFADIEKYRVLPR